jgi:hypothetical protein
MENTGMPGLTPLFGVLTALSFILGVVAVFKGARHGMVTLPAVRRSTLYFLLATASGCAWLITIMPQQWIAALVISIMVALLVLLDFAITALGFRWLSKHGRHGRLGAFRGSFSGRGSSDDDPASRTQGPKS